MKIVVAVAAVLCLAAPAAYADTYSFEEGGNMDPTAPFGGNIGDLLGSNTVTGITIEAGQGTQEDYWQTDTSTAVVYTDGNTGLTITATATANGNAAYVYGDTWQKDAGIGVYTAAAQAGANDNIQAGEALKLVFSKQVQLRTSHVDKNHDDFTGNETFVLHIDGGAGGGGSTHTLNLKDGVGGLSGTSFEFVYDGDAFYVTGASVVPEPSTLGLLAAGLVGLFVVRRRSRSVA